MTLNPFAVASVELIVLANEMPLLEQLATKVRRISVESHLNLPSVCEIEFADPQQDMIELTALIPGALVEIRAVSGPDPAGSAIFFGRVESVEVRYDAEGAHSAVRAYDIGHTMLHGAKTRGFPMMTYSSVVEEVCLLHEIPAFAVPHPVMHDMVVQANETDWDFVVRLGQEIGYIVAVEVDAMLGIPKLYFGPPVASETAPPPVGIELSPLAFAVGDERILSLRASMTGSGLAGMGSAGGWDPKLGAPAIGEAPTEDQTIAAEIIPEELAEELSPGSQSTTITRLAASEAEAESVAEGYSVRMAAATAHIEAEVRGNPSIRPNLALSLSGFGLLTGDYTITSANHIYDRDIGGYRTLITCSGREDRTLMGLGDAAGKRPQLNGVYPAIVTDVEDTEGLGRVLLSFPWLSETFVSNWARVLHPSAGPMMGWQLMPSPTDEVMVAFENGQLDSPIVIGGVYSETRQPALGWNSVVVGDVLKYAFTSREGHQLIVDDSPESTGIHLQTTLGSSAVITISPELGISIKTMEGQPITINSASDVTVSSEGEVAVNAASVTINGEGEVSITAEGAVSVEGSEVSVTTEGALALTGSEISLNAGVVNVAGGIVNLGA